MSTWRYLLLAVLSACGMANAAAAEAPQQCTFHRRVAVAGEQSTQEMRCGLDLKVTTSQAGQTIKSGRQNVERRHVRSVSILKVDGDAVTRAQVAFELCELRKKDEQPEADPALAAVVGKSYIVSREDDELIVTGPHGEQIPDEERSIVEGVMEAIGRPNPLAKYFDGRTMAVGEKISLPSELAQELLGFAGAKGDPTRCELQLAEIATRDGARMARFDTVLAGRSHDEKEQTTALLKGVLWMSVESCRVERAEFAGPVATYEQRGPIGARFQVSGEGELTATMQIKPHGRVARK